jgi:hypothetical protein
MIKRKLIIIYSVQPIFKLVKIHRILIIILTIPPQIIKILIILILILITAFIILIVVRLGQLVIKILNFMIVNFNSPVFLSIYPVKKIRIYLSKLNMMYNPTMGQNEGHLSLVMEKLKSKEKFSLKI